MHTLSRVPPIVVSCHVGWFSTSMIMGERVGIFVYKGMEDFDSVF